MLDISEIENIFVLHRLGWSVNRISKEIGRSRSTIRKYLDQEFDLDSFSSSPEIKERLEQLIKIRNPDKAVKHSVNKVWNEEMDRYLDKIIFEDLVDVSSPGDINYARLHRSFLKEGFEIKYSTFLYHAKPKILQCLF